MVASRSLPEVGSQSIQYGGVAADGQGDAGKGRGLGVSGWRQDGILPMHPVDRCAKMRAHQLAEDDGESSADRGPGLAAHGRGVRGVARAAAGALGVRRRPAAPDGAGLDAPFDHQAQHRFALLDQALAGSGCEVLVDGPQILTEDISAIPDVVVTCAPLDLTTPVIAAPAIIVEVMSPSTACDDHGLKWLSYRKIASLRHYIIVAQDQRLVHLHSRAGDIWRERFVTAGSITLDDPPVTLELDAIYAATDVAA